MPVRQFVVIRSGHSLTEIRNCVFALQLKICKNCNLCLTITASTLQNIAHLKLQTQPGLNARYPYLVEYEWVVSGRGRGDLVFASPHGDFAVVEAKT